MLQKAKAGDFAGACAIYARVVPFPAILSHICDRPCEAACRRAEAGGAIRIAALEKACVENAYASIRRMAQPSRKPKRVAVAGAGLAGLTAAFDLAMKGHNVTVFEAGARPLERLYRDYSATSAAGAARHLFPPSPQPSPARGEGVRACPLKRRPPLPSRERGQG